MPVRPVVVYPDPRLKQVLPPVKVIDDHVRSVARDLLDTMLANDRCVGLAAPQIGEQVRIVAVNVWAHPKASASHGLLLLVNPQVTRHEGFEVAREGCLSLPSITANVGRPSRIAFEADLLACEDSVREQGKMRSVACGFEARAILHEIDHLDGILLLDRVASPKEVFQRKIPGQAGPKGP